MGMSTHVVGIKPPDATWKKMKKVWDTCKDAGVDPPDQVRNFFGDESPDEAGVVVEERELQQVGALKECRPHESAQGYEVDLRKLPPDIKIIRFYNSW
jgi:hypothetical protein